MARLAGVTASSVDGQSDSAMLGTPEGTIVTIVETYTAMKGREVPEQQILHLIEKHRSKIGSGKMPSPATLRSYIRHRVSLEYRASAPVSDESIDHSIQAAKQFFSPAKERTMLDEVQQVGGKLIISGYRRIAAQRHCAPGPETSDADIVQIYKIVGTAFQDTARKRGEILPAAILNNIVLFFLQKYQMFGRANPKFFAEHLEYETAKYQTSGLRAEYRQPLNLF